MSAERPTGWEGADRWFAGGAGGAGRAGGAGEPPAAPDGGAEEPLPPRCEVCGAPLEPDQTYCLECGSPTPLAPRLRRGGRTAAILAAAMVVLGLGAGALAFAVVRDDGGGGTGTVGAPLTDSGITVPLPPETAPTVGTLPADTSIAPPTSSFTTPTAPSTSGFDTVTGPSSAPASTATPPPTTTSTPATGASDWPSGRTAWTAVLASTHRESDARAAKGRVAKGGDPAGVLFSSDFPGLRPGYWVVFSGTYDSRTSAIAQAAKLRPEFPSAYARRIQG